MLSLEAVDFGEQLLKLSVNLFEFIGMFAQRQASYIRDALFYIREAGCTTCGRRFA